MSRKDGRDKRGLTRAELTDLVYNLHGGLTKHEAAGVVEAILDTVKTSLLEGKRVKIKNFGVFEVTRRQGRQGVDPSSGEPIYIPPHRGLSFRPASRLKQVVDGEPEDDA